MLRAGRADGTVKKRRMYCQYLYDFLGRDPFYASESDLENWQDSLAREQIRNYTLMVSPYFGWVHAKGLRSDNPAKLLVTPKAKRGIPRPVDIDDFTTAVGLAPDRLVPWFLLAAYAGLRAKEIAFLWVEDFHPDGGAVFIHLRRTKGERERVTVIPVWVWEAIRRDLPDTGPCWHRARGTGPVTPQQISQSCNDHLRKCKINKTLHCFRHWAGTQASETTGDLLLVQSFLGHADPAMAAVYAQVRPQRLAKMVEQFPRIELPERLIRETATDAA